MPNGTLFFVDWQSIVTSIKEERVEKVTIYNELNLFFDIKVTKLIIEKLRFYENWSLK